MRIGRPWMLAALALGALSLGAGVAGAQGYALEPGQQSEDSQPGGEARFNLTVRNTGVMTISVNITHSAPPSGWSAFAQPTNFTVAAFGQQSVSFIVNVGEQATANTSHQFTIQASSGNTTQQAFTTVNVRAPPSSPPTGTTTEPPPETESQQSQSTTSTDADPTSGLRVTGGPISTEAAAPHVAIPWADDSAGAFAAAGFTGSLAVLGIAVAVDEAMRYRLFGGLASFYARLARHQLLDQSTRSRIHQEIKQSPGISYGELRRSLELHNGSLSHHLRVLARERLITAAREGFRVRFFPPGQRLPPGMPLLAAQRGILEAVMAEPGITQKELRVRLGLSKQLVNYHVLVLARSGRLRLERAGRTTRCFADAAA